MTMTQKLARAMFTSLAIGGFAMTLSGCELGLLVAAVSDEEDTYEDDYYYDDGGYDSVGVQLELLDFQGSLGEASFNSGQLGDAWVTDSEASITLYAPKAMTAFYLYGEKRQQLFSAGSSIVLDGGDNLPFTSPHESCHTLCDLIHTEPQTSHNRTELMGTGTSRTNILGATKRLSDGPYEVRMQKNGSTTMSIVSVKLAETMRNGGPEKMEAW